VFHPSSASSTFCNAVSRVKGGNGGRSFKLLSLILLVRADFAKSKLCRILDPCATVGSGLWRRNWIRYRALLRSEGAQVLREIASRGNGGRIIVQW
jgi:hypothetical protein